MKVAKAHVYVFLMLTSLLLGGCIDEVEIDGEGIFQEKLVIEGQLRKGETSSLYVQVSQSIPYEANPTTNYVGGGSLTLIKDSGEEFPIPELAEGQFSADFGMSTPFEIETGSAYKIHLRLGANTYESTWDTLFAVPKPDSLSVRMTEQQVLNENGSIIDEFRWQARIHTPLSVGGSVYQPALKWDFSSVWLLQEYVPPPPAFPLSCYISEEVNLDKVVIFNPSGINKPRIDGVFLMENILSYKVAAGYYLTALQQSLSQTAFVYWDQVSQVVSRSGGFLETPPGKIRGNISQLENPEKEVLGLFYVSEIDTVRVFIRAEDFPMPIQGYCNQFPTYDESPVACKDCLTWANSTYARPPYWRP